MGIKSDNPRNILGPVPNVPPLTLQLAHELWIHRAPTCDKDFHGWGTWLAQSIESVTLHLRALSSSATLEVDIFK